MAVKVQVVVCTFPDTETAARIGSALVEEALAACINIIPGVRSIYRWEGRICDDAEVMGLIKTTEACFDALRARVVELHPYDCPEVVALPVADGHPAYLDWVRHGTTPNHQPKP
ncbi:MAG: divalent-cation tolerance protein CutA [Deltaproteobacteria bacterium]|nr:divalent-cation tolerance protein CutA [Deltaproteobacteria bacterium]